MNQRKDMGEIYTGEIVPPTRMGRKAVVEVHTITYVEVDETDDWRDMEDQAKDQLNKRIVASKGFYPMSSRVRRITTDATVDDFRYNTFVDGKGMW